ncbi:nucleotidyltransferase [Amphibacillus sp. MSJ-3]|uniref:cyclic GMP-AMP synthase DncV-like nucleotidyltransferase n=1 Tax=Amphibacillus sp. MSJ-3 TaxID=2841505 RepID=UPI001C0EE523|nr:nucleotidyltransferase [Amphibacillus sp. MSJ-3]MBU5593843.1 nucleotidyltransferase [Amphibacillus sp. MSJ-3]
MVNLQKNFISFHDLIKLDYDDNSLLREYRDQIINGLKDFMDIDYSFSTFVQGSYSVFTGIKSSDENIDFDIDVGLAIEMSLDDCQNPITAKKWVRDAIQRTFPNAKITIKNPCITVNFSSDNNNEQVHVDIAVYAVENENYYLARGKEYSSDENIEWEVADPKELKDMINNYSDSAEDRKQFRRCIRYLKRWKDNKFKQENRPTGIGLTVLALEKFSPNKTIDWLENTTTYNDLKALHDFTSTLLNCFNNYEYDKTNKRWHYRIKADLPVKPYNDAFCKMTSNQMEDFKTKLDSLNSDLKFSIDTLDEHEATKKLNKHFGDDFVVVDEETVVESSARNSFVSDYPSA